MIAPTAPIAPTRPPRHRGRYEDEFWGFVAQDEVRLQAGRSGALRYPPGPVDPGTLDAEYRWTRIAGSAHLVAWTVFRRSYFPDIPVPYTVVVVRIAEGPLMVGHLPGDRSAVLRHGMEMTLSFEDVGIDDVATRSFTWIPREHDTEQDTP
jgi:uncharacterized OB-fold protein